VAAAAAVTAAVVALCGFGLGALVAGGGSDDSRGGSTPSPAAQVAARSREREQADLRSEIRDLRFGLRAAARRIDALRARERELARRLRATRRALTRARRRR
jgi:hypothetical protein